MKRAVLLALLALVVAAPASASERSGPRLTHKAAVTAVQSVSWQKVYTFVRDVFPDAESGSTTMWLREYHGDRLGRRAIIMPVTLLSMHNLATPSYAEGRDVGMLVRLRPRSHEIVVRMVI